MLLTNVYIDGFNLYYGALRGTPYKWLDLDAACRRLLPKHRIGRIRYFTAIVSARPNDPSGPDRQRIYLRALETFPHVSVHLGHFLTNQVRMPLAAPRPGGPRTVEVIKTEEKGSDVNLATYLLADVFRKDCEAAVVITNDSDLKEPIRVVRYELGLPVGVVNPHPARFRSRDLLDVTFFKQLRPSTLAACQLPDILTDQHGTIHKPATWRVWKSRGPAVARPRTQPANRLGGYMHRVQHMQVASASLSPHMVSQESAGAACMPKDRRSHAWLE